MKNLIERLSSSRQENSTLKVKGWGGAAITALSPFLFIMTDTTITAISSAQAEAGIGVIRISGPESLNIAKKITNRSELKNRYMHYCKIMQGDKIVDEALVCYMQQPHTYTGEDVVEIQCHGSSASLKEILSMILDAGAEMAEPGEFTKRAFLNGKMDLSQAEAVIDLIKAKTKRSLGLAAKQLGGALSKEVSGIRDELKELLIQLTVNMDYPDEDIEEITYNKIEDSLSSINDEIFKLIAQSDEGKILREGLSVAIIGKPNVGKSSLMNIFMGEERSIVTSVAGTTRDTIEESAQIRGIPIRLIDTAGIHQSEDIVEKIGIEKSKQAFESAQLVLLILDSSKKLSDEDRELINASKDSDVIVVLNKTDLPSEIDEDELKDIKLIKTSFTNNEGIDDLKDAIEEYIKSGSSESRIDPVISNIRHINLVKLANAEIAQALEMCRAKEAIDFIEINVKAAFDYLGEISGDTASGEIIDEIFSRFCLGK